MPRTVPGTIGAEYELRQSPIITRSCIRREWEKVVFNELKKSFLQSVKGRNIISESSAVY